MSQVDTGHSAQGGRSPKELESEDPLVLKGFRFRSRLVVGTGKYRTPEEMQACHEASGAEMVTVAIRRVDFTDPKKNLLNYIDRSRFTLLPNTAGCYTAQDAIRVARQARELLETELLKLEVIGDKTTLLPDPIETLKATELLVKEGFTVLVYTSDDPVLAHRLQDAGATSVMPAGSPIGSGQGILNPSNIRLVLESLDVPVIVDAGVGTASDVSLAFELGVDGVLLNTAIAEAREPVRMARAMHHAAVAGREAYLAGRIARKPYASASSPTDGMVEGIKGPKST